MGQGGYPTADQVARGWLKATDVADLGPLLRFNVLHFGTLLALPVRCFEVQWVLFAALRTAFPGLTWEQVCRMTGLTNGVDLGDLGRAVREVDDFWPRVQAVFGVIVGPGR